MPGMSQGRARGSVLVAGVALAALVGLWPASVVAQGDGQTRVSYDVEISTLGSLLDDDHCAATGTDVLTGTLVGMEPAEESEDNEYVGTLTRTTRVTICGTRRKPNGEDVICTMSITGNGFADVILTVYADERGAWLKYITNRASWGPLLPPQPAGPQNSVVNGTCDPAEMAQLQNEYAGGQTGGSPSGQLLEVPGLPPASYPFTFPATPPTSIWTLKVLARRQ